MAKPWRTYELFGWENKLSRWSPGYWLEEARRKVRLKRALKIFLKLNPRAQCSLDESGGVELSYYSRVRSNDRWTYELVKAWNVHIDRSGQIEIHIFNGSCDNLLLPDDDQICDCFPRIVCRRALWRLLHPRRSRKLQSRMF